MIKNRYKVIEDYAIIYLDRRDGVSLETIIDLDDLERVLNYKYKWVAGWAKHTKTYYATTTIYLGCVDGKSKNTTMHLNSFIMNCPDHMEVDHIDHNTLNNRKENLRVVTVTNNHTHRAKANKNNSTGFRNVCFFGGKYIVQMQVNGVNTKLGSFDTAEDANQFAEQKRKEIYGEFCGN